MKYVQKFLDGYLVHEQGDEPFHADSFLEAIIKFPIWLIGTTLLGCVFFFIMLGLLYLFLHLVPYIMRLIMFIF